MVPIPGSLDGYVSAKITVLNLIIEFYFVPLIFLIHIAS